jgi:hypothetical protein
MPRISKNEYKRRLAAVEAELSQLEPSSRASRETCRSSFLRSS